MSFNKASSVGNLMESLLRSLNVCSEQADLSPEISAKLYLNVEVMLNGVEIIVISSDKSIYSIFPFTVAVLVMVLSVTVAVKLSLLSLNVTASMRSGEITLSSISTRIMRSYDLSFDKVTS